MCEHETKLYGRCLACGEQVEPAPVEEFTAPPAAAEEQEHAPGADAGLAGLLGMVDLGPIERRFSEVDGILGSMGQRVAQADAAIADLRERYDRIVVMVEGLLQQPPVMPAESQPAAKEEQPAP